MASEEDFSPVWTTEMKRELSPKMSPPETPPPFAPAELEQSADTSPGPSGEGKTAPCDAVEQRSEEMQDVQHGSDGQKAKRVPSVCKKRAGKANEFSSLSFPQRLWKIVESDQFKSIWWSEGGKCVAINEGLFEEEVLERKGPMQVFAMKKMNSFLRKLNLYGFTKTKRNFTRSASLPEFLAEEAAIAAHNKLLYYYNPSFHREYPHLLENVKRRAGIKRRATDVPEMDEEHPSRGHSDVSTHEDHFQVAGTSQPRECSSISTSSHCHTSRAFQSSKKQKFSSSEPLLSDPGWPPVCFSCSFTVCSAHADRGLSFAKALCGQSPTIPHCPTCTCSPNPETAGEYYWIPEEHIPERARSW